MKSIKESLEMIGHAIDKFSDCGEGKGVLKCIDNLSGIEHKIHEDEDRVTFYYLIANAWASLYQIENKWAWNSEEKHNEIYNLRKALNILRKSNFEKTDISFRVKTNLANSLNNVGRFSEAIEL